MKEKLSIEEIIAHCERVTKNYEKYGDKSLGDISNFHAKEYWEHRQVKGYLEELQKYREIGTVKECCTAVEKQKADKELESHDEKHILKSCLGLMQEMVNDFAEWYRWQHGEDSIEELDEEEIFCIRKTYFRIVQKLFLLYTNHSGGTSTRAKCEQLGVDWGEEISFDWSEEE